MAISPLLKNPTQVQYLLVIAYLEALPEIQFHPEIDLLATRAASWVSTHAGRAPDKNSQRG